LLVCWWKILILIYKHTCNFWNFFCGSSKWGPTWGLLCRARCILNQYPPIPCIRWLRTIFWLTISAVLELSLASREIVYCTSLSCLQPRFICINTSILFMTPDTPLSSLFSFCHDSTILLITWRSNTNYSSSPRRRSPAWPKSRPIRTFRSQHTRRSLPSYNGFPNTFQRVRTCERVAKQDWEEYVTLNLAWE